MWLASSGYQIASQCPKKLMVFLELKKKIPLAQLIFQITVLVSGQIVDFPPVMSHEDYLWCKEGTEFYPDMHILYNAQEVLFQDV